MEEIIEMVSEEWVKQSDHGVRPGYKEAMRIFSPLFFNFIPLPSPCYAFQFLVSVAKKAGDKDCKFITITATCHPLTTKPHQNVYLISAWKRRCFTIIHGSITEP